MKDYFGAPVTAMGVMLVAFLLVLVLDPVGAGVAGGVAAGAVVAGSWLVASGIRNQVPLGILIARLLFGAAPALALIGFAALGVGGQEAFDGGSTLTGAVVGAITLLAGQAGRIAGRRRAHARLPFRTHGNDRGARLLRIRFRTPSSPTEPSIC